MIKLVGVSGAQGAGKSTLLEGLKAKGWAVDSFKVSRAVQKKLGWDSLERVMDDVHTMQRFQEEVLHQKLLRDFDMGRLETSGVVLTERTFADIAAYTWLGNLFHGAYNRCDVFLSLDEYRNVERWVRAIDARPAAIRGRLVNTQAMPERHSAADFDKVEDRSLFDPVRKRPDTL